MRHQRVVTDNTFSSLTAVTSGTPQGTALVDPTLFVIYINDIIDNIHYSKISRLFTDNIILYKQVSSVNDVNRLQSDPAYNLYNIGRRNGY